MKIQTEDFLFEQSEVSKEFSQKEVSDLVRDFGLSKQNSMLLASRLKSKNVLSVGTKVNFYQNREKELRRYFSREDQVVFCNNVSGLLKSMGLEVYKPEDWRLFIDSSKASMKAVLLHITQWQSVWSSAPSTFRISKGNLCGY